MIVSHVSARPKAVRRRRASGFVLVTLCLLTFGQRKLKWREQANALIERIVGGWSAIRQLEGQRIGVRPFSGLPVTWEQSARCKARLHVLLLGERLVSADLRIPIRRRIGEELTRPAEGAHRFFIDFDA